MISDSERELDNVIQKLGGREAGSILVKAMRNTLFD